MLHVKKSFAVLCELLFALQPRINFKFYIDFCYFSNQIVLFLAINDAMASSPQVGAAIDSWMRILKEQPRHNNNV